MKKIIPVLVAVISLAVFVPVFAADYSGTRAAEELCRGQGGGDSSPICEPTDIFRILKTVVQYTYTIFFIVAVIFILFAAYQFLFARGEPEKIKGARNSITWAVVAIAIAMISVGAAQLIKNFLQP